MSRHRNLLAAAALAAAGLAAAAPAIAQPGRAQKARLALELEAVEAGEARLAAVVEIDEGWHLQAHVPTYDYLIPTVLTLALPRGASASPVEYPAPVRFEFAFAAEELDVYEGTLRMPFRVRLPAGAGGPATIEATLRYQACDDRSCLPPVDARAALELRPGAGGWTAAAVAASAGLPEAAPALPGRLGASPAPAAGAPPTRSLAAILLLALLGGFVLNGMPCVLPILSLKLFGLVQAAGRSRGAVRSSALATAAGILVSFWALAAAAIAARSAGAAVGWGVQFQQPGFVAFLAVVILLFTLNLWGLFEIRLPTALARRLDAGAAGGEGGHGGHFASGLFATLMATPCSAPFLGTALSFALGQSPGTIAATLTAVGAGLALPYLVLAAAPAAVRFLPRPGAWMDTLRGALGFLLASALIWLLYVLAAQVAPEAIALFQVVLLAVGLALWLAHRAAPGGAGRRAGWAVAVALAIAAIALVARAPAAAARTTAGGEGGGVAWQAFDRAEAERLARGGRLVFVDVTADWCITCKVNERLVLNAAAVVAAFREHDVVAMKADWTNRNDEIAAFLAEHGRYGIPFYLLYRPGRPPHLFGELITQQGVIGVLEESAGERAEARLSPARPWPGSALPARASG